jgi:hypothetical protein
MWSSVYTLAPSRLLAVQTLDSLSALLQCSRCYAQFAHFSATRPGHQKRDAHQRGWRWQGSEGGRQQTSKGVTARQRDRDSATARRRDSEPAREGRTGGRTGQNVRRLGGGSESGSPRPGAAHPGTADRCTQYRTGPWPDPGDMIRVTGHRRSPGDNTRR